MYTDGETWKNKYQTIEVDSFLGSGGSRENFHFSILCVEVFFQYVY